MDEILLNDPETATGNPDAILVPSHPDKPVQTEKNTIEKAFYATTLNPSNDRSYEEDYSLNKFDIQTTGSSENFDQAELDWRAEQEFLNKQAVADVISDPTLPIEARRSVLEGYNSGLYTNASLKEKYKQKMLSVDSAETGADRRMQEAKIDAWAETDKKNKEIEDVLSDWGSQLDGSYTDAALGIARDFIPGAYSVAASQLGRAAAEFRGLNENNTTIQHAFHAAFVGTGNKTVADLYNNTLDPDQRIELLKKLMAASEQNYNTDYNAFNVFNDTILDPAKDWKFETFQNVVGFLDLFGLSKVITSPVKWIDDLISFQKVSPGERAFLEKAGILKKSQQVIEKVDPTMASKAVAEGEALASNPPTGSNIETPPLNPVEDTTDPEVLKNTVIPKVKPQSPAGVAGSANPPLARNMGTQAIQNPAVAESMGTNAGEIVGEWVLPKLDDTFGQIRPDLAKNLEQLDKSMHDLFTETRFDPFLVPVTQREADKAEIFRAMEEVNAPYYQQSNSTYRESLGKIEGKALFGRNQDYGFESQADAVFAKEKLDKTFPDNTTSIINRDGSFFVQMDWKKEYDPFSARFFGADATKSSFAGFDTTFITRNKIGNWLFNPTFRLPTWVTQGAATTTFQAARVEQTFLKNINDSIRKTQHPRELQDLLDFTLEEQKWLTRAEVAQRHPNLTENMVDQLMDGYISAKRHTDYIYNWANRFDRAKKEAAGHKAIYDKDNNLVGYGSENFNKSDIDGNTSVWDFDVNQGTKIPSDLSGRKIVRLETPMERGNEFYEYAVVGGSGSKLDLLPFQTMAKIEGYLPRGNVEHWYVIKTPKQAIVNGKQITDFKELNNFTKTIGAGATKKDAEKLVERMKQKYGDDFIIDVKRERGDTGDAILTDYKVYKELVDYGSRRGERLPTLTGNARLEDPLVKLAKTSRTIARMGAWQNYDEIFQKNFMRAYGNFLPRHEFPNVITDLKILPNATEESLNKFKDAQRLFEQYTNQRYKLNWNDIAWKAFFHKIADVLENTPFAGLRDVVRDVANKGDLGLKSVKSLSNTLFLKLNPAAQWIIQPQQIMEYTAVEPAMARYVPAIPSILLNILSNASDVKPYKGVFLKIVEKITPISNKEIQELSDAIYKTGLPQSVDLNMMLHGSLDDLSEKLDASLGRKVVNSVTNVVKAPGEIGAKIGYSSAQMAADISAFLFAKLRWERMNPGKNWNTLENVRQIAADSWDIAGSMSSRAGALPYQDGYLSLFFQFAAHQHKQFMQVFSSKTLKKANGELVDPKAKLAAARTLIYGMYGTAGGGILDWWVQEHGSIDQKVWWNDVKGGILDAFTNKMVDMFMDKEGSDLAISARLSPVPENLPYWDFIKEATKLVDNSTSTNPRFPFLGSAGSMIESAQQYKAWFQTSEPETPEAMMMLLREAGEMTSGWKNWQKAMQIYEFGDKKNKLGNNLGLELDFQHAIGQVFGIVSQQELAMYRAQETKAERDDFIKTEGKKIHDLMLSLKDKIGDPEYNEHRRRINVLMSSIPTEYKDEIMDEVLRTDRESYTTKKESILFYIRDNIKYGMDNNIKKMVADLKTSNSKEDQQFLRRLEIVLPGYDQE